MNRKNLLLSILAFALLASTLAPVQADAAGGKSLIHLSISNIQPQKGGSLVVLLYDKDGWLEPAQAIRHIEIPVDSKASLKADLTDIPYPATYAVQLFQDENSNHKMDMHWFPYPHPSEPYGFSNNYKPFAKPSFKRAAFPLNKKELTLQIKMRD